MSRIDDGTDRCLATDGRASFIGLEETVFREHDGQGDAAEPRRSVPQKASPLQQMP